MRKLLSVLTCFLIVTPLVYLLGYLDARIDAAFNSWLPRSGHFRWSMLFSQHVETLLWLNDRPVWLLLNLGGALLVSSVISIWLLLELPGPRRFRRGW